MIQFYRGEEFKKIEIDAPLKLNYAISNYGRLISYQDEFINGRELKGSIIEGFRTFPYDIYIDGKRKNKRLFFYRLVAENFLPNDDPNKEFILHLDYDKLNDQVANLKWATMEEKIEHHRKNPAVILGRKKTIEFNIKADGRKLTSTQVIRIKKMLLREDNKTRLVMIAKQFNITTQQLYRIRTGENWGHIKV
jgi:hypothetical protein